MRPVRYHADPIGSCRAAAGSDCTSEVRGTHLQQVADGRGIEALVGREIRRRVALGRGRRRVERVLHPERREGDRSRDRRQPRTPPAADQPPEQRQGRGRRAPPQHRCARPLRRGAHDVRARRATTQPSDSPSRRGDGRASPNRVHATTRSTDQRLHQEGLQPQRPPQRTDLGRPVDDRQDDHGEQQQPRERPPTLAGAAEVHPAADRQQPDEIGVGQHVSTRCPCTAAVGSTDANSASGSVVNLPPKPPYPVCTGRDRRGEHAREVDGDRHQPEQDARAQHPAGRRARSRASKPVHEAGHDRDDQHDRAEDVAHGHQQVARRPGRAAGWRRAAWSAAAPTRPRGRAPRSSARPPTTAGRGTGSCRPSGPARRRRTPRPAARRTTGPGGRRPSTPTTASPELDHGGDQAACRTRPSRAGRSPIVSGDHSPHWPSAARFPARQAWGSSVRPLPVPDQVAEVVPPAVVGRRGVAVPEVVVVADQQQRQRDQHGAGGRPRPRARRRGRRGARAGHRLTAARNTDEPNGRSRRASTRRPAGTDPAARARRAARPGARRRRRRAGLRSASRPSRCRTARTARSATKAGNTAAEPVRRAQHLEPGVLHRRDRTRPGVAAVVAVGDVVVGPGPLVRRHREQQPAAGLEHPAQLGEGEVLRVAVLDHVERADHLEAARRRTGSASTDPQMPVGRPQTARVEVERDLLRRRQPADARAVGAADVEQPLRRPDVRLEDGAQHLGPRPVPPVVGLVDRRGAAVRGRRRRAGHRGRLPSSSARGTSALLSDRDPVRPRLGLPRAPRHAPGGRRSSRRSSSPASTSRR